MSRVRAAEHAAAAAGREGFPPPELPEVAFLGRSNVGKSSLLNRLMGRRRLAHTSRTPGKTRLVHFYRVERGEGGVCLVDLPGYGFARVSRAERQRWRKLVEGYLEGRDSLRACVLLQDLRRDVTDDERDLLAWLAERGVPTVVALTKIDKLKPMRRAARIRELKAQLADADAAVLATSAQGGEGIPELWRALGGLLREKAD
jgi:GTP-binding protein